MQPARAKVAGDGALFRKHITPFRLIGRDE
jgi:hypothetical protein